jgi:hypothetical protein
MNLGDLNPLPTFEYSTTPIFDKLHQEQQFIGGNTLSINMATMIKAIEFWLNSEVLQCDVTVKSVDLDQRGYMFIVQIEPQEDEGNGNT